MLTVEQAPSGGGEVLVDICTYDTTRTKVSEEINMVTSGKPKYGN